jgi:hypothetical protein
VVSARSRTSTAAALAVLSLTGCGGGNKDTAEPPAPTTFQAEDPGPVHVHGLGVNPADGALFIATHTGLFRAGPSERVATRVAGRYQDTMGFTVVGPDRFLGSGHPDLRTDQPPYLGLIRSADAGNSWEPVSLYGKADFHVLESSGLRIVGYGSDFETRRQQLLVSDDGGKRWSPRRPPMPLIDLAVSPSDPDVWVAAGSAIARTADGGRTWQRLPWDGGLLAWQTPGQLFRADAEGNVSVSRDAGETWTAAGNIGGQPAALEAHGDALYAALHDGVIKQSEDGGRTWTVRSRPQAAITTETTSAPAP